MSRYAKIDRSTGDIVELLDGPQQLQGQDQQKFTIMQVADNAQVGQRASGVSTDQGQQGQQGGQGQGQQGQQGQQGGQGQQGRQGQQGQR